MTTAARLATSLPLALALALVIAAPAQAEPLPCPYPETPITYPGICHPYPQPRPQPSTQSTTGCPDDCVTTVDTGEGIYPASNPFDYQTFPGTNFLPNVYTNMFDGAGNEMVNTLPSTPSIPYNLHDGDPVVSEINKRSPENDLHQIITGVPDIVVAPDRSAGDEREILQLLRWGIDIVEGNPIPNRAYSGFPLLHFTGPEKTKKVVPIKDQTGTVIGGNVDVRQLWYGQHIVSDTAYLDPSEVENVPWTVTYTVDVLDRGHDDFSPFVTYVDPYAPGGKKPHVGMDQSFFNMEDGTRTVFKIKMTEGQYLNLIYTWGWRSHPPRIQVMENATKKINYSTFPHDTCPESYQGLTLPQIEQAVFCPPDQPDCTSVRCAPDEPRFDDSGQPTACEQRKQYAISRIGELAPAKRILRALTAALETAEHGEWAHTAEILEGEGLDALLDWMNRTELPKGVPLDPDSDVTIFYVNNTIYGELTAGGWVRWEDWVERPQLLRVTAYNGDTFPHSYIIADFGGNRGWENQFKSSTKVAGSGCWFTFGRAHWWMPAGGPNGFLCVPPPADEGGLGKHRFEVTLNFDPSRRLRFYQFDPFHHDMAIYSLH